MLVDVYFPGYEKTLEAFGNRVIKVDEEKYHIPKFIEFQYGELSPDCKPHLPIIRSLEKHGLWKNKGYPKGFQTLKEKEKEKDKQKDKEKGGVEENKPPAPEPPSDNTPPQENKPLTDIQKVVSAWKMLTGYKMDDKAWDKAHFSRHVRSAKKLIEFLGGWRPAIRCMEDVYEKLTSKGLSVQIETILKHSSEWKIEQNKRAQMVGV